VYFDCSVLIAARLAGARLFSFINAIAEEEMRLGGWRLPLRWALHSAQRLLAAGSSGVYTISSEIAAWLSASYAVPEELVKVIKNGVDTAMFSPGPAAGAARSAGLPAGGRYIGFVGRPADWHGLEYLVDAAGAILAAVPSARFLVVGDGPALPRLREYARQKGAEGSFIFTGSVPHARVPDYIRACEVCVVFCRPVRSYPGDPMKLYEYLACGRPVLASDAPGYGDLVEKAGAGLSVNASDPAALAAAAVKLLSDESALAAMGARARAAAVSEHDWSVRSAALAADIAGRMNARTA